MGRHEYLAIQPLSPVTLNVRRHFWFELVILFLFWILFFKSDNAYGGTGQEGCICEWRWPQSPEESQVVPSH